MFVVHLNLECLCYINAGVEFLQWRSHVGTQSVSEPRNTSLFGTIQGRDHRTRPQPLAQAQSTDQPAPCYVNSAAPGTQEKPTAGSCWRAYYRHTIRPKGYSGSELATGPGRIMGSIQQSSSGPTGSGCCFKLLRKQESNFVIIGIRDLIQKNVYRLLGARPCTLHWGHGEVVVHVVQKLTAQERDRCINNDIRNDPS